MSGDKLFSKKRIFSTTFIVVLAIMLSKISGLARDQVMAGYYGISYDTDAFIWAYFIPNLFRVLIAESLIVAAFIPIYTSYLKKKKTQDLKVFVSSVANIMAIAFFVIAVAVFILSPEIGSLLSRIANSQLDVSSFALMNRIMIFSLVTLGLSGMVTGILNSHNIFTIPSMAPLVLNIFIIIFVTTLFSRWGIIAMAAGVMVGSVAHLAVQLPQLKISGLKYRFILDLKNKGVKEIFSLMFPILLSLGAVQLNNSIDNFFALGLGGGNTTALTLSWRVANLPLGVFSVAIITVLYPLFSRQAAEKDVKGLKESFSLGVREIGYLMIPATAGLLILSRPIIRTLFEHYNFSPEDTKKVALILVFHSLGLVFFGLLMILNRVFYAFKNVRTPLKIAAASILVNLGLDWVLIRYMDINGLALSTSLVALFNVAILLAILRKKIGSFGARRIIISYLKIIAASAVMSAVIYFLWGWFESFASRGLWELILLMLAVIVIGAGVYMACTFLFRMDEVRFVLGLIKRFRKKK